MVQNGDCTRKSSQSPTCRIALIEPIVIADDVPGASIRESNNVSASAINTSQ